MQSEDYRVVLVRQRLNRQPEILDGVAVWYEVCFAVAEAILLAEGIHSIVLLEDGQQTDAVPIVSDPPTVVDMAGHVYHRLPGDLLFIVVQEQPQSGNRYLQIALVEFIADIEAQRSKLSPFLDDSMEEAEAVEHLQPLLFLHGATVYQLLVEIGKRSLEVGFQSPWWLYSQFYAVLQDGYGEVVSRHTRQHQPECWIVVLGGGVLNLNDLFFQIAHPALSEMAVLEKHPAALFPASIDQYRCLFALTLSQRYNTELLLPLLRESENRSGGVSTL